MAVIEEALYSLLSGDGRLTDLVSTRIYPVQLPQPPVYPCLSYQRISTRREMRHDGPGNFGWPWFQFDCYAETYSGARALANTLRRVINGYQGTVSGVEICGVFPINEVDDFGGTAEVYRIAVEFRIIHKEQVL